MTTWTSRNARPGHPPEEPGEPDGTGPDSAGHDSAGRDGHGPDSTRSDSTRSDSTGNRLIGGRYRLAEPIGRGAMGTVWRARDELLDREVAVKEVRLPSSVSDAERENSYQRTLREARTAARLSHPGVAAVYDVVAEFGRPWIVMELVTARSLDQVIAADGPLSPERAADMGRQVLAALTTAHAAGVLHRDVKPSNVLLARNGRTVLTDFGIATAEGDPSLTQTGMVMGSPGFLAPERIRGGAATPASDLWSLGATLYAAVEGQGPYDRHGGVMTTMAAVITEDPPAPKAAGPLTPVISALLSRDPAGRPSAQAAARMLDAIGPRPGPGGTLRRTETVRPSAILPPGAAPPGSPPWAAARAPAPVPRLPVPMGPPPAGPPPAGPRPAGPPPVGSAVAHAHPPMGHPPMADPSMGPASMGPRPMEPTVRRAAPHHGHRAIIFVIIGVVIFLVAALATAKLHTPGSATTGTQPQSPGTGPHAAPGKARSHGPAAGLPAGFRWYSQRAGAAGSGTAGFRVALPPGWRVRRTGMQTFIEEPGGARFLELDLTPHTQAGMLAEILWLQRQSLSQGTFPGYHRYFIRPVRYQGTVAADWAFSWLSQANGQTDVLDRALIAHGPGGSQSFAIYWSTPAYQWQVSRPLLGRLLATFAPVW